MDKIDKIINIIRDLKEEMMTTGSSGPVAGFSGAADPEGPTAGSYPVMGFVKRKRPQIKRWSKKKPPQ